jgi:hypothetical protein
MQLQFNLTFKRGPKTVATIEGQRTVDAGQLTVAEMSEKIPEVEQFIEKLTGVRLHIEHTEQS